MLAELDKGPGRDHTKLTVNGFTALGLVGNNRKRTRESLGPCAVRNPVPPAAAGARSRPPAPSATKSCGNCCANRQFNARDAAVLRLTMVIDLYLDEESQSLAVLLGLHRQGHFPPGRGQLRPGAVPSIVLM